MNLRRVVVWSVVALIVLYVIKAPDQAAQVVQTPAAASSSPLPRWCRSSARWSSGSGFTMSTRPCRTRHGHAGDEEGVQMTTTWESVGKTEDAESVREVGDGGGVTAPDLDAVERMYDEAMACIAEMAGPVAAATADPWPETEEIDVNAIKPPTASSGSSAPEPASPTHEPWVLAGPFATSCWAASPRPWWQWFSIRANRSRAAR